MKIAISANGDNLDSLVDARFGRCPYFLIVENGKVEAVSNTAAQTMRGAGIVAAQIVVDQKVDLIITGNVGPNAFNALQTAGIKVFQSSLDIKAKDVLKAFKKDKLEEIKGSTV